jgi:tetratricopeptide (TPR) repeat protein
MITTNPQSARAHHDLGRIYWDRGGYKEAVEAYEKAVMIDSLDATMRYILGSAYIRMGRVADGRRELEVFQRLSSRTELTKHATIHYNLATIYARMGNHRAALDEYAEVIRIDPDYPKIYHDLAHLYGRIASTDTTDHRRKPQERH